MSEGTAIVLITHQTPRQVEAMCREWSRLNPGAEVLVAYGGRREDCDAVKGVPVVFVEDPRLRTRDHQRERQSYRGVMREASAWMANRSFNRVLLAEYDVIPLRSGICTHLEMVRQDRCADVLGVRLRRIDRTGNPHYLAHCSHRNFSEWLGQSIRENKEVVLSMLGCLSYWTREAFVETGLLPEPFPVYLELALGTVPHLLGFRVRGLPDWEPYFATAGDVTGSLDAWRANGVWAAHPAKRYWTSKCCFDGNEGEGTYFGYDRFWSWIGENT